MGGLPWVLVPLAVWGVAILLGVWVFSREAPWVAERL
jgi:hypothetical protein